MNSYIVTLRQKPGLSRISYAKALGAATTQMRRMKIREIIPDGAFIQNICDTHHVNPDYFKG